MIALQLVRSSSEASAIEGSLHQVFSKDWTGFFAADSILQDNMFSDLLSQAKVKLWKIGCGYRGLSPSELSSCHRIFGSRGGAK